VLSSTCHLYRGLIKNISRRGIFVETKGTLNVGQIIKLVIPGTGIDNGVMLKGEVIRCDQTGIGVEFKSQLRKKGSIKDPYGRRSGGERRQQSFRAYSPGKRSGEDRRDRADRRKAPKT
jgi:hypothetical protein